MTLSFAGQIAVVTGAGAGLGREMALLLARLGANLLVNDYGGDTAGAAGTPERAEQIAAEIRNAGGVAVANAEPVGSVAAAQAIHKAAMDAFGRVDILINNAGVMAIGPVDQISDHDLERCVEINYLGAFRLVRAFWPGMKKQGYGRILNLASNSFLGFGGISPYSSSKSAILGLTAELAIEGQPHGILANCILPVSYTRLAAAPTAAANDVSPKFLAWLKDNFSPSMVAPTAAYLVSRQTRCNGEAFTTGGGRVARLAHFTAEGYFDPHLTADAVADNLDAIRDMSKGQFVGSGAEELMYYTRITPTDPRQGD